MQAPVLLDKRCILGQGVRLVSTGRIAGKWNPNTVGMPGIGRRIGTITCKSWLNTEPLQRDAHGGWSQGEVSLEKETKKGIPHLILVGGGMSLAICLAVLVHFTVSKKGFRAHLCPPMVEIHELFTHLTSRALAPMETLVTALTPAKTFDHSLSDASKTMPTNLEDQDWKEKDSDTTKIEVSRAPETSFKAETKPGKIYIPPAIDSSQCEALSVLEKLQIVESHIQPGELCMRREYARWFLSSNSLLSRRPNNMVFPSVYIEGVTQLAFDDITPQDPDFPYIQGLAEAGIIPSKLSNNEASSTNDRTQSHSCTMFYPDSPLSRVDLVTWKIVVEHNHLSHIDKRTLEKKSGFLDVQRISTDAWPAIFIDASAGDKSITQRAFGYSRRFQPDKPVTKGQVAVAIISGQMAATVSEELSRLEAENSVKEAVIQEILSEMISRGEIKSLWEKDLDQMKLRRIEAEEILELAISELEKVKDDKERSLPLFLKEKAMLEFEQKFLSSLKVEVDELKKTLLQEETELLFEKEQLEQLRLECEVESESLSKAKSLVEAEKRALILSRLWVEEEAKRTQARGEMLAEAVKRWKFTESCKECSCWCHHQENINGYTVQEIEKSANVSSIHFWPSRESMTCATLRQYAVKSLKGLEDRAQDLQKIVLSTAGEKANDVQRLFSKIYAFLLTHILKIFQKLDTDSAESRT